MPDPRVQHAQLFQRAKAAHARGQFAEAVKLYRDLLSRRSGDVVLLRLLGSAELGQGLLGSGCRRLEEAITQNPRDVGALVDLARGRFYQAQLGRAQDAADRALRLEPDRGDALLVLTQALCAYGRPAEAERLLHPHVQDPTETLSPELALAFGLVCLRTGQPTVGVRRLSALAEEASTPRSVLYALADLYEAEGSHADAWALYCRANAPVAEEFDATQFRTEGERLLATWREIASSLPTAGFETQRPVFVVGLPRSGLGLVEQIIASHPQTHTTGATGVVANVGSRLLDAVGARGAPLSQRLGAITQQLVDRAGGAYLNDARQRNDGADRIVERLPGGFTLVGWVRMLLPGARVIHVVRESLDTGVSCFTSDVPNRPLWTHDLQGCGAAVSLERTFMRHWNESSSEPTHTICYEQIIEDPEAEIRRLIEFLELPWNDDCLRFHESEEIAPAALFSDIRRPIHARSVGVAENYREHLGPLISAISEGASVG